MQILPARVPEKSSAKITCNFKDRSDGSAVTPASVTWSLFDLSGNVINSRQDVVIAPASSIEIWLNDADLALTNQANDNERRRVLVNATYNNGVEIVNLKDEGEFAVYNLTGVS